VSKQSILPDWPAAMPAEQAARYCGVSPRKFREMVSSGLVEPRRLGARCILYLRPDLDSMLAGLPVGRGVSPSEQAERCTSGPLRIVEGENHV
jgi:hypothetical protein